MITETDLYLRLSDGRVEEALEGREAKLRAEAARRGWIVRRVIIENDINGDGTIKGASAWKRKRVTLPNGRVAMRVVRPKFRDMLLPDLMNGANVITEYVDRITRDHRDGEDFLEAVEIGRASAVSLNGRLNLTEGGTDKERDDFRDELRYAAREGRAKSERAANGRERWAGKSYQGGRRPFGYRVVKGTEQHHRNLALDEAEAKAIRDMADDILTRSISRKAIARDLRESGLPTVTGVPWTGERVKDVLIKPAIAGLAVYRGELRDAPWPAILPRDRWERLRDLLTITESREVIGKNGKTYVVARNPSAAGNEPRWLVSGIATCGICGAAMKITGGTNRSRSYVCSERSHLRRNAPHVDEYIADRLVKYLSRDDMADLLRPPPRPGTDVTALRAEARKLRDRKTRMGALYAAGTIDDDVLASGTRVIREQLAFIESQLAASDAPDPLAEFRGNPAGVVWENLSMPRRRAVARSLMNITILPSGRRGSGFDQRSVLIDWKS